MKAALLAVLAFASSAVARIGDTWDEFCKQAEPDKPSIKHDYDVTNHLKAGRRIMVTWINGKSVAERHYEVSPDYVRKLLADTAAGQWVKLGGAKFKNGNITATLNLEEGYVNVDNGEFGKWFLREREKQEKEIKSRDAKGTENK